MKKFLTLFLTFIMLSAVPAMAYEDPNRKLPLESFTIVRYNDGTNYYQASKPNQNIYKSRALTVEAIQGGNGNISYVSIDGVQVPSSDYTDNKTMYEKDENRVVIKWRHEVRIKPYVIEKLALGSHRIAIVCSGQQYTTKDQVLVDSVTFNLVDATNPISVTSISLNNTNLNLGMTDTTYALAATVSPTNATNKAVMWKSSNTAVATVDQTGKVTPVTVGTTTITCTANDGSGKFATCKVMVNPMALQTYLRIEKGNTSKLEALLPRDNANNNVVTCKSNNTAVATVDNNGNITGVGVGFAIITCIVTDRNGQRLAETVCNVNVYVINTSIKLYPENVSIFKTDKSIHQTITATVSPTKAVTWKSSNTDVATVDTNGKVTILATRTGTAIITCTANDGSASATCNISVV